MGITEQKYFWLKNQEPIKNLKQLADFLEFMDDSTFNYHVNSNKNDFYNWILGVFNNKDLADKIKTANTSKEMHKILTAYLNSKRKVHHKNEKKEIYMDPMELEKIANINLDKKLSAEVKHPHPKKASKRYEEYEKFSQWLKEFFFASKEERKVGSWQCPYKNWKCGFFEFLFGILVGIIATMIILNLVK